MKKRYFYYLLKVLRDQLESAELDEALKGDKMFELAYHYSLDRYDPELVVARMEHRLAEKKVKMIKKEIKRIERIHNESY